MGNDDSSKKCVARVSRCFSSAELAHQHIDLSLIGDLGQLALLEPNVRRQLELAFQEAVANSLDHGNLELDSKWREEVDSKGRDRYEKERSERLTLPKYRDRKVTIIAECDGYDLEIRIGDEGPGFVPKVRPITPGDTLSSGRGLALIEQCLDEVRYERGGREVVMRKCLQQK